MLNVVFSSILMFLTANRGAAGAEKHPSDAHAEDAADRISDQLIDIIRSPHLQRFIPSVLVVVADIVVVNVTTNETKVSQPVMKEPIKSSVRCVYLLILTG